jgi:hypothetical protein
MHPSLASLKDIHMPAPESWWHLAWGWLLLLGILALLGIVLWANWQSLQAWNHQRKVRNALKEDIQAELAAMRNTYEESHDGLVLLAAISSFIRRVSITVFERETIAGLIEDAWLDFLDSQWGEEKPEQGFSHAVNANLLKYGAYQQEIDDNMQLNIKKLLDLSEKWAAKVVKDHV